MGRRKRETGWQEMNWSELLRGGKTAKLLKVRRLISEYMAEERRGVEKEGKDVIKCHVAS